MESLLTEYEANYLVRDYMTYEGPITLTQEIIDSGAIPRLRGYTVQPGKVSDSIFGGTGYSKEQGKEFENPPLYYNGAPARIMLRTNRISTHDKNRGSIPFKDQILAMNHQVMRRLVTTDIGTSQYDVEDLPLTSVVILAENLTQIPFENVIRAYMAKSSTETSLYQHYKKGTRIFCGHVLPSDLVSNGPLPYVMDTPSTKSDEHDESVTPDQLFTAGVCTPEIYKQILNSSLVAFGRVGQFLSERGLILVDTKTEHGINNGGNIVSQDELYTMDSSRFWLAEDYKHQMTLVKSGETEGLNPKSFSKEFARGLSKGEEGYTDDQRAIIAVRYIMGIQHLLGREFEPDIRPRDERVITGLQKVVEQLD